MEHTLMGNRIIIAILGKLSSHSCQCILLSPPSGEVLPKTNFLEILSKRFFISITLRYLLSLELNHPDTSLSYSCNKFLGLA